MAKESGIAWTRSTFNPWIGCTKVSPGCDGCYAEALDKRKMFAGATHWGPGVPRLRTSPANWNQPRKWNEQAGRERAEGMVWQGNLLGRPGFWPVFCSSLADVFDNEVPDDWRRDLFSLIELTPNLSWLLVTKRIGNVFDMVRRARTHDWLAGQKNVRLLITVVNQEEADRDIPKLLRLKCKNGISYEPALGSVDWSQWLQVTCLTADSFEAANADAWQKPLEWIIVGGESSQGGHRARPFDINWARSTVAQCKAAGVPVFVKQLGSNTPGWCFGNRPDGTNDDCIVDCQSWESGEGGQCPDGVCAMRLDRAGADTAEWPVDLRVREFPDP